MTQNTAGVGDTAESGDLFGDALAFAAPGLGDPVTRLGVGVPSEDAGSADQGMVQVFPMTDLDGEGGYTQASPGMPGGVDAGDRFGSAVAVRLGCLGAGIRSSACPTTSTIRPGWSM